MRLYLVRHAIAAPRETPGLLDDRSRELTPSGVRRMRRSAAALRKLRIEVDEIWTSPLARAKQTANLLAEVLEARAAPRVVKALEPGGDQAQLMRKLAPCIERNGIALVGHEPDLGRLATQLLGGPPDPAINFKKGGVACIEVDDFEPPLRGRLHWLLTPRQMKMMT
jgi:phosphohistidine phosphatase